MRILMLVWTDVAHDARVLREMRALVEEGHSIHVVGRAVPEGWQPPSGVTVSSARARSPFRRGAAPSTEGRVTAHTTEVPRGTVSSIRRRGLGALRGSLRWLLLPEHVELSVRSWAAEAYRDTSHRTFDVVHAHDFTALRLGARLAREHATPLVYDAHEWWSGRARHGRPEPLRRRRQARLERRLAVRASAVLTVSDGIAEQFRAWGTPRVLVVRNTFPVDPSVPMATGLTGLVYAGRVAEGRDLTTALRAWSRLAPYRLVLLGPTDPTFLPPTQLPGGVESRPAVDVDEVDVVLREVGAALVSLEDSCLNHRLALPNKIFQAVRAGVPIVAADLPEIRRLVSATGIGTLYRPGDPGSLVAAVRRLAEEFPERLRRVEAARSLLRWQLDAQVLVEVYRQLETASETARHHVGETGSRGLD